MLGQEMERYLYARDKDRQDIVYVRRTIYSGFLLRPILDLDIVYFMFFKIHGFTVFLSDIMFFYSLELKIVKACHILYPGVLQETKITHIYHKHQNTQLLIHFILNSQLTTLTTHVQVYNTNHIFLIILHIIYLQHLLGIVILNLYTCMFGRMLRSTCGVTNTLMIIIIILDNG
jgi:hypothetical protein